MEQKGMSPILKAVLYAIAGFAIVLGIAFIKQVLIDKGTFSPNWVHAVITAVALAVLSFVGPNADQRKQNRQDLRDKLSGKK